MNNLQKILGISAFALLSGCEHNQAGSNSAAEGSGFPVPVEQKPSEYIEGIVVREGGTLTRALESGNLVGNLTDASLSYIILLDAAEERYSIEVVSSSDKSRTALAEAIEVGDRIKIDRSSWTLSLSEDNIGAVWSRSVHIIAKKDQIKAEKEYTADKK